MNRIERDLSHCLRHTEELWDQLRDNRIFITGGTGFFGCWLLETFLYANARLNLGARAVVLTRDRDRFRRRAPHLAGAAAVELHPGGVTDFDFPSGEFSHIIHAAVDYTEPLDLFASIVEGTRRTLDFARRGRVKRYLFTSSGAVYGKQPPHITHVPECYSGAPDPLDIASAYGEGKRAAEFLCKGYHDAYKIETTISRGFAFVGPYLLLDGTGAIGNFIRDALARRRVIINGDGTPRRSYLYASDLAIWLWTILFRGMPGRAYNVGSPQDLSIRELAEIVVNVVAPGLPIETQQSAVPGDAPARYVPSVDRAKEELGLEPLVDVREGIARTAEWSSH